MRKLKIASFDKILDTVDRILKRYKIFDVSVNIDFRPFRHYPSINSPDMSMKYGYDKPPLITISGAVRPLYYPSKATVEHIYEELREATGLYDITLKLNVESEIQ